MSAGYAPAGAVNISTSVADTARAGQFASHGEHRLSTRDVGGKPEDHLVERGVRGEQSQVGVGEGGAAGWPARTRSGAANWMARRSIGPSTMVARAPCSSLVIASASKP